jgi:tetraspanin-18
MEFNAQPFQSMQRATDSPQVVSEVLPDSRILKRKLKRRKLIYCVCSFAMAKSLLVLLNILYVAVGCGVLGVGFWAGFDKRSFIDYTGWIEDIKIKEKISDIADETPLGKAPILMVILGAIILLLNLLGCCAAAVESRCLLTCYAMMLLIIMLMEIAAGPAAVFYRNEARNYIKAAMKSTLAEYAHFLSRKDKEGVTLLWNSIMVNYECCGVDNYTDLHHSKNWENPEDPKITIECCILKDTKELVARDSTCIKNPTEENSYMNKGCYNSLAAEVENYNTVPTLILCLLTVSLAMGMILAFCLCQSITAFKVKELCEYRQKRRTRAFK